MIFLVYFGSKCVMNLLYSVWQTCTFYQSTPQPLHRGTTQWWRIVCLWALNVSMPTCHEDASAGHPQDSCPNQHFQHETRCISSSRSFAFPAFALMTETITIHPSSEVRPVGPSLPQSFPTLCVPENHVPPPSGSVFMGSLLGSRTPLL